MICVTMQTIYTQKTIFSFPYTRWGRSHFTLLESNKTKRNIAKKIGYISTERRKLEVSLGI